MNQLTPEQRELVTVYLTYHPSAFSFLPVEIQHQWREGEQLYNEYIAAPAKYSLSLKGLIDDDDAPMTPQ